MVVRLSIVYRRPAGAGDTLTVTTHGLSTGRRKVVIGQEVRLEATDDVCVEAEVTAVFLDADTGRPIALTEEILRAWPELGGS